MDIKEFVGKTVIDDIENVTHALKLQELVKERIKKILSDKTTYDQYVCLNALQELQSLVEESEK